MAKRSLKVTHAARRAKAHSSSVAGVHSADPKEHEGLEAEAPTPLPRNIDELRSLRDKIAKLLNTLHVGVLAFFTDQEEHLGKQRECGNLRPGWGDHTFTIDCLKQPGRLDSLLDSVPIARYLPPAERDESLNCVKAIGEVVEMLQVIVGFQEHEPGSWPRLIELRDSFCGALDIDPSKLPPPEKWTVAEAERFAVGLEDLVVSIGKDRVHRVWKIWNGLAERIRARIAAMDNGAELREQSGPDSEALLSSSDLAKLFKISRTILDQRLKRWRQRNQNGWKELENKRKNEPRIVYRLGSVRPLIDEIVRKHTV